MSGQGVAAGVIVVVAAVYLVWHLLLRGARPRRGPDVSLARLRRSARKPPAPGGGRGDRQGGTGDGDTGRG